MVGGVTDHDLREPHVILVELVQISGELVGDPDHDEVAGHRVDTPDHLSSSTLRLAAHWT